MKISNKKKNVKAKSIKSMEKMEIDQDDNDGVELGNETKDDRKVKKAKSPKKLKEIDKDKVTKKALKRTSSSAKSLEKGPKPNKVAKTEDADGGKHKVKLDTSEFEDRKKIRKMRENKLYDISCQSKVLWEELRKADLDPKKRSKISLDMFQLVTGKCAHLVFAHDTSRVVQSLIKYGTQEQKNSIFLELKEKIIPMMKSKFAKFIVRKFLKYGNKDQRIEIYSKFEGHLTTLIKHKEASEVVECAYNDFANATQRNHMEMEFYGPNYALNKKPTTHNIIDFIKDCPDKRDTVIDFLKEKLNSLIEKSVLQMTFVHKLFHDYFEICDKTQRSEMIETMRDHVIHFIHTKVGSRVAMKCFWFGNAKDRKIMIKTFKTFVLKVSKEEFGHFVLLAMFDCVDDTKFVQKAILDELLKNLDELVEDQYGRKVLLYLLCPRKPLFFHPDVVKILSGGDGNEHSKKDSNTRQSELLFYISPRLVEWITSRVKSFTVDNSSLLFLAAALTSVTSDPTNALKAVSTVVAEPFASTSANKGFHFIDDSSGHMTLKKLIQNDGERMKRGEEALFSTILLDTVTSDHLKSWVHSNRGCFTIVNMLELGNDRVTEKIKEYLSNYKATIKKLDSKGAQILLKKLSG